MSTGRVRRLGLVGAAALALLAAATLPRLDVLRPVPRYQATFDISQSMDVEDVAVRAGAGADGAPLSRLALSKRAAAALVARLPCGSRIGWSVFVGQRVTTLVEPLEVCAHYEALLASLGSIDGRMRWENSSGVGKGLHQSLRAASEIGEGTAVLMFTDGQEAPPLREGATGMPKNPAAGVGGFVVGVGGDVPVRVPKTDVDGRRVGFWDDADVVQLPGAAGATSREALSSLRAPHLRALAELAGLGYVRLQDEHGLWDPLRDGEAGRRARVAVDYAWLPALAALLALLWRFRPRRPAQRPALS